MNNVIYINVGEMAVCNNKENVRTTGIGSCVVISLYCKEMRLGGLLHAMLPSAPVEDAYKQKGKPLEVSDKDGSGCKYYGKYVDEGLDDMIFLLEKAGAKKENLKAKMTGGATMLSFFGGGSIGDRNVEAARKKLKELGVSLEGEEVGGKIGRMAELNIANGILDVSTKM